MATKTAISAELTRVQCDTVYTIPSYHQRDDVVGAVALAHSQTTKTSARTIYEPHNTLLPPPTSLSRHLLASAYYHMLGGDSGSYIGDESHLAAHRLSEQPIWNWH